MSTATTRLPEGRYGRSSDERADRTLKIVGAVLGALLLALIGYFAYHYVGQNKISGEVISFDTSNDAVKVHLEVRKDAGTTGYCTLRSQSEDGGEVGRADFRFGGDATRIDKVVTLRTTARGTTAELLGCHAD
ncbi:membrane protein [Streptomyces fumigatiscleroticus]|nr:membrane protein [Streptomyces fumigatiscleroticus]